MEGQGSRSGGGSTEIAVVAGSGALIVEGCESAVWLGERVASGARVVATRTAPPLGHDRSQSTLVSGDLPCR